VYTSDCYLVLTQLLRSSFLDLNHGLGRVIAPPPAMRHSTGEANVSWTRTGKSCVIVVENLPVPFDRRVWQEAQALRRAGLDVSVICPATGQYRALFETIDGIDIHRHGLPLEARGRCGFLVEYGAALFHQTRLLAKIHRRRGIDVIQACNPPDLGFLAALPFKLLGARFIFDQHDLSPELYESKFGRRDPLYWLLRLTEWLTYRCADHVVTANDAFRELALSRGGVAPDRATSVYSIPDLAALRRVAPEPGLARDKQFVLGYLGVIGDQDGVDGLIRAIAHLVQVRAFSDFHAVIVGDGPALPGVRALARDLGLEDFVTFTGFLSGETLLAHLSAFDVGVIPDPPNPSNDKMSMNKVFEYCALGIPTAAFPLAETRRLLGDAGVYARGGEAAHLAEVCLKLMQDAELRQKRGACARRRAATVFQWEPEARKYLAAYARTLGLPAALPFIERRAPARDAGSRPARDPAPEWSPTP
jgi:glycosyltransferase involved in cell wall biosynthesis